MDTLPHSALDSNLDYVVYALVDQRDFSVFYVGITDDVYARFAQHLRCDGENPAKDARILELKEENVMLIMKTLEKVQGIQKAREREAFWIQHYRFLKVPLLNQLIPSIRMPKRVRQPMLFRANNNGRRQNNDGVKELVLYRHIHGKWPTELSSDMKSWYEWFYFTEPRPEEQPFRGKGYEQHFRAYRRGRNWIAENNAEAAPNLPEGA